MADLRLLGDARGGERSVRTARDTEKMNQKAREVLLAKMLEAIKDTTRCACCMYSVKHVHGVVP